MQRFDDKDKFWKYINALLTDNAVDVVKSVYFGILQKSLINQYVIHQRNTTCVQKAGKSNGLNTMGLLNGISTYYF